ncbi:unnamed protein product [Auanema sp. JU1783]|nr:unnamed protein product [Auanema sp. JU1783]
MMPQDTSSSTLRPLKKKIIKINRLQKLKALPIVQIGRIESTTTTTEAPSTVVPTTTSTTPLPKLFTVGKPQLVMPLVRRKISLKPGSDTSPETSTPKQKALNAGYNNYYQEWYKNTETTTARTFTLPTIPPAWAQQLPTSGGGFYGIIDPRLEGKHINKEQLDKMCISIKGLTKAFGIKKPKTFAEQNCSLIKMYYKQVTCEQIIHVMEYCEPMLSTRRH